jgi:HSP20 family protein
MNNNMTTYSRKNNWNPIQELKQEMDRLFETAWSDPAETLAATRSWQPSCDLTEDQDHYLLSLEMAGVPKEQIKIEVVENQLVVSGERKYEDRKKEHGISYTERRYGKFQRSFALPIGLDTEKIEANCQDGVLRILIPKSETAKPRQIKIGTGSGTSFFGKLIGQSSTKEKEVDHSFSEKPSGKIAS